MTSELIKYEAACRALAECKAIDEVKTWHDKAAAMQAYGRMANDKTLEIDAAEIRIRAERRLGEMITQQKEDGGLSRGAAGAGVNQHTPKEVSSSITRAPKLADAGISYDLSSRAQKLAAVPDAEFEAEVGEWRERVGAENARVTARLEKAGERAQQKTKPKEVSSSITRAPNAAEAEALRVEISALKERIEELEAQRDEIAANLQDTIADNESMARVFEADDKLAAAIDEAKRYREQNRILEDRVRGLMNEKNEAIRAAKSWQRKYEKLEREMQAAANDGIDPAVGF